MIGRTLAVLLALTPRSARAVEYETFVDVDDEDGLYDLLVTDQISERSFVELVDLLRRGVDLNEASREELYALPNLAYDDVDAILGYRERVGPIASTGQLVVAGVLSRRQAAAIEAFVITPERAPVTGSVRYRTVWTVEDRRVPPMALQARVTALRHLRIGAAALLDRNRVAPPTWDPNRDALVTDGPRVRPRVPKAFVSWETPRWGAIAGTYGIGFGQRLVFDTTGRSTPNGFVLDDTIVRRTDLTLGCRGSLGELTETPCPYDRPRIYVTPDYDAPPRLHGLALGAKQLPLRVGWLQAYAFFSMQRRSVYQYEIWNRDACADPRVSSDVAPECAAPPVLQPSDDLLAPAPGVSYSTLPDMTREIVGGGNFGWWYDARTHVGVTGYGATVRWLVEGVDLSFQDSAVTPAGGPWGAVGVDAAWGRAWADVFVELAHAFDSMPLDGVGGPAGIVRHTASWRTQEVEISARYYDGKFANPFARAPSGADERGGLRARDEAGGRLRWNGTFGGILGVRSMLDAWTERETPAPKVVATLRADVQALPWLRPGAWSEVRSHACPASAEPEQAETFGVSAAALERSDASTCAGERFEVGGRVRFDPHARVWLEAQYQHDFTDDATYGRRMRQGSRVAFLFAARPIDALDLRLRARWDDDDLRSDTRLSESVWGWVEVGGRLRWFQPSLRYDVRAWIDGRQSTALRRPNPEHWLHVELRAAF